MREAKPLRVLPSVGNAIYWSNLRSVRDAITDQLFVVPSRASIHTGESLAVAQSQPTRSQRSCQDRSALSETRSEEDEDAEGGLCGRASDNDGRCGGSKCGEEQVLYKYALNVWVVDTPFNFDAIRAGNTTRAMSSDGNDESSTHAKELHTKFCLHLDP